MPDHQRVSLKRIVSGLALLLCLAFATAYALAQGGSGLQGVVRFSDRSLCYYSNAFFEKKVFPVIQFLPTKGLSITFNANQLGVYGLASPINVAIGDRLLITCDKLTVEHILDKTDVETGQLDITLPNHKPVVTSLHADLDGVVVRGVPGGTLVTVTVSADDPDGDSLGYEWRATDGAAQNTDAPQTTWLLPKSRGLHFIYVLVHDSFGGYTEKQLALSTDGDIVPEFRTFLPVIMGPTVSRPPSLLPSDHVPATDQFLTYAALARYDLAPGDYFDMGGPLDNRFSACTYYRDIGAVAGCKSDGTPIGKQLTFDIWKQLWGFGVSDKEISAKYANLADLNLQRDMHTISTTGPRPGGGSGTDVASYVCNYPNPDGDRDLSNVRLGNNLVACVAFEFSVTNSPTSSLPYNGGQPFTKFYIFGPTGDLLLSVNLDGRGEKFLPGACAACHGGSRYSGQYALPGESETPALNAQFIPYDLDNYRFSSVAGFRRQDQETSFWALNQAVLATQPLTAVQELIQGWYPTPANTFDGSFVPTGWHDHADLYNSVVKPACRMCHSALDADVSFNAYSVFASWKNEIWVRVCGSNAHRRYSYAMPNARQTFDQFWTNSSPSAPPGANQVGTLLSFLMAEGVVDQFGDPVTACALPDWLP